MGGIFSLIAYAAECDGSRRTGHGCRVQAHVGSVGSTMARRRSGFLIFASRDMLAEPGTLTAPCARPLGNQPDQMVPVFAGSNDLDPRHAA